MESRGLKFCFAKKIGRGVPLLVSNAMDGCRELGFSKTELQNLLRKESNMSAIGSAGAAAPLYPSGSSAPHRQFGLISNLIKDPNPPNPEVLGLDSFEEYRHVEYLEDLLAQGITSLYRRDIISSFLENAKENIRLIKEDIRNNGAKYYFRREASGLAGSRNPYVGKLNSNGQFVWGSISPSIAQDAFFIARYLACKNQAVYINRGTHGDEYGNTAADDLEAYVGARYGDEAHIDLFYKSFTTVYKTKVACGVVNHNYTAPLQPEEANHVINGWCMSIRSRFTSNYHLNTPIDLSGNFLPPDIRCARLHTQIKVPYFFAACQRNSSNGAVHSYDIQGIAKWIYQRLAISIIPHTDTQLQQMTPRGIIEDCVSRFPAKKTRLNKLNNVRCCVLECNAHFDLTDAKFSETTAKTIEAFNQHKQKIEAEKAQSQGEITRLKEQSEQKDGRIDELEADLVLKDAEINKRDTRIVEVEVERDEFKEERNSVIEERNGIERERDAAKSQVHEQAIEIEILREGSTFESFVSNSSVVQDRGINQLRPVLQYQLQSSEHRIEEIFKGTKRGAGRGFFSRRPNAFVKPTEVFDTELTVKTNLLVTLFLKTKADHLKTETTVALESYDVGAVGLLSGSVVYAGFTPLKLSDLEKESFLHPLMDRLIRADRVSSRLMEWMKHHKVSIEINTKVVSWDKNKEEHEGWPTVFPKTYEQTIAQVLKTCLRFEVADSMLKNLQIS